MSAKTSLKLFLCTVALALLLLPDVHAQNANAVKTGTRSSANEYFTGTALSLSVSANGFLTGLSPFLGYSPTTKTDLGVLGNWTYSSRKDYLLPGDQLRHNVYGGGAFAKFYPVNFLFAQAQIEHNWIQRKYNESQLTSTESEWATGNSLLVGGGFTLGRRPGRSKTYGHFAVLYDILNDVNSVYRSDRGSKPLIRMGFSVPL